MYKINSDGATINNEFTNGNPSLGVEATVIDAAWLNAVQRELIEVVENAGLTPSDVDDTQIRQALDIKLSQVANKTSNVLLEYAGGALKLVGTDGNDFSASNVGRFTFPDGKNLSLTTSPSFTDGIAGNMIGQEFGITNGADWNQDRPQFIYAAYDASDNLYIFTSPDPTKKTTPSAANMIGYHNNASSNNTDRDIFVWTATNVTVSLQNRPCMRIGGYRHQWNGTSFYWTVTALSNVDGIGKDFANYVFTFPSGQMGATSGKYFADNGGTAPTFATSNPYYELNPETGFVSFNLKYEGSGATFGAGAVNAQMALPYEALGFGDETFNIGSGQALLSGFSYFTEFYVNNGSSLVPLNYRNSLTNLQSLLYSDWAAGSRHVRGSLSYKAF